MQRMAPYRLLVVRLGAMGDILHALPAIAALRRMHPLWRIDWMVEPRWRALLSSAEEACFHEDGSSMVARSTACPIVDRILTADTRQWRRDGFSLKTVRQITQLRRELHAGDYDAVLDVQGAIRSAILARLSGCRRVLGDRNPREKQASWLYSEPILTESNHVIDRACELASAVAADPLEVAMPPLPVDAAAEAWRDQLVQDRPHYAVLHPGAGWGAKRWPPERYRAVADWLAMQGIAVWINAGPDEQSLVAAMQGCHPMVRCVSSSLAELIALTRKATLVIGGDTGPLHLASALGRPVVGIYGPTDPARNGPYRFPDGAACLVLRSPESRRNHRRLPDPEPGLLQIDVASVCAAAEQLLSQRYNQQQDAS